MGDPLLAGHVDLAIFLIVALKALVAFVFLLIAVMLMVWFERKIISDMQHRIGPNQAGPWGILQTLADGTKLFFKEDLLPQQAERRVFRRAPLLMLVPAYLIFALIPIGGNFSDGDGTVELFGHRTYLQLADPPVGILFFIAMSAIAVYGIMLAGWSSGSKYPLLASVRASAQMVSYEAALGLSIAAVILVSGAISTHDIVMVQAGDGFGGFVPNWNVFVAGFVPAAIFLIAGAAEAHRPPFDLTEAEQELVGGYNTEYSSVRFALFYLAEFMGTITMSAIMVTLFFGGPSGPILTDTLGFVWPILWFFLKLVVFLFIFVWLRGTLPRLRYDQLMDLGWKRLIPASLGWFLFLGTIRVANSSGWSTGKVIAAWVIALAVLLAAFGLLVLSLRAAARTRTGDGVIGEDEYGELAI